MRTAFCGVKAPPLVDPPHATRAIVLRTRMGATSFMFRFSLDNCCADHVQSELDQGILRGFFLGFFAAARSAACWASVIHSISLPGLCQSSAGMEK